MKILCLLNENPFPPRNGLTIPMYNQMNIMKGLGHELETFVIRNDNSVVAPELGNISFIKCKRKSRVVKIISEIILSKAFYEIEFDLEAINACNIDTIYYSPISLSYSANKLADKIKMETGIRPKVIASISDCYTSVLRNSAVGSKKITPKRVVNLIRSFFVSRLEAKSLNLVDSIYVQTAKDKSWLKQIGVKVTKVTVLPNGVDEALFSILPTNGEALIFVGNLASDYYASILHRFIDEVFLKLLLKYPDIKLHVYTSGSKNPLLNVIYDVSENIIFYDTFIDNISDVYEGKSICIAPIFKSYGFINKVAEAMSAGLAVVGDRSAFNGIDAVSRSNCMIANNYDCFYSAIDELLSNKDLLLQLQLKSKSCAKESFSWSSRIDILNSTL
jgi:glycosyltransferase involved in cell wall biosynthesis